MSKTKIEIIKSHLVQTETAKGISEYFDYPSAMEEYANQEKIAFAIETLGKISIEREVKTAIFHKINELKSLQDEQSKIQP